MWVSFHKRQSGEARGTPREPEAAEVGLTLPLGSPRPAPPGPASSGVSLLRPSSPRLLPPAPRPSLQPDVLRRSQGRPPPTPRPTLSCGPSPGPLPAAPAAGLAAPHRGLSSASAGEAGLQPLFLEPPGRPLGRPSTPRPARQAGTAVTSVSGAWKRIWEERPLFAKGHEDDDFHSAEKTRSVPPVLSTASRLSCQQLARSLGSADPQLQTASESLLRTVLGHPLRPYPAARLENPDRDGPWVEALSPAMLDCWAWGGRQGGRAGAAPEPSVQLPPGSAQPSPASA